MVFCDARIGVPLQACPPDVDIPMAVVAADEAVVGGYDGESLVVGGGVDFVGSPRAGSVVDVHDEHSMPAIAASAPVPTFCLTIVQDVVFVGIGVVDEFVPFAVSAERIEMERAGRVDDFNLLPFHEIAFVCGIADGILRAPCVHAVVHDAPVVHTEGYIVRVVEVGQSDGVAYLMYHHSDSVCLPVCDDTVVCGNGVHLAAGGAARECDAIDCVGCGQLFRPDCALVAIRVRVVLAESCKDNHAHVHLAVAVVVELRPVLFHGDCLFEGFADELRVECVLASPFVPSVVAIDAIEFYGTYDGEFRGELSLALVDEVLPYATIVARSGFDVFAVEVFVVEGFHSGIG